MFTTVILIEKHPIVYLGRNFNNLTMSFAIQFGRKLLLQFFSQILCIAAVVDHVFAQLIKAKK